MTPFDGTDCATVSRACTTSSASVALSTGANRSQVIVTAPSGNADLAFIRFGTAAVVATAANGIPILPGSIQTFSIGDATHMAGICPTSTATIYATTGKGE